MSFTDCNTPPAFLQPGQECLDLQGNLWVLHQITKNGKYAWMRSVEGVICIVPVSALHAAHALHQQQQASAHPQQELPV